MRKISIEREINDVWLKYSYLPGGLECVECDLGQHFSTSLNGNLQLAVEIIDGLSETGVFKQEIRFIDTLIARGRTHNLRRFGQDKGVLQGHAARRKHPA